MPKGYLVTNILVKDKKKFVTFSGIAGPLIKAHGVKILAKGPGNELHKVELTATIIMF